MRPAQFSGSMGNELSLSRNDQQLLNVGYVSLAATPSARSFWLSYIHFMNEHYAMTSQPW
jgi:hypothetical protein